MNSLKLVELTAIVTVAFLVTRLFGVDLGFTEEELIKLLLLLLPLLGVEVTEAQIRGFLHKKFPNLVSEYPKGADVVYLEANINTSKKARKPKR